LSSQRNSNPVQQAWEFGNIAAGNNGSGNITFDKLGASR
jgi:hypothetical protein